ncbi:hypothetical protein [Hoeflea sp.]|uniref:hypothetical protein n=1 Tax=Hoeflea sp. TaxID=1940281 RepID=UPI003BAF2FE8
MSIIQDNQLFEPIATEFVIRYVAVIARLLDQSPLVDFSLDSLTDEMNGLLFDLCFFGVVQLEEQSGFEGNGKTYTPRVAFETDRSTAEPNILLGDTIVHGLIETPVLEAGLARARTSGTRSAAQSPESGERRK